MCACDMSALPTNSRRGHNPLEPMCVPVPCDCSTHKSPEAREGLITWSLNQTVVNLLVWVLGTKPTSSGGTASDLNQRAISHPHPQNVHYHDLDSGKKLPVYILWYSIDLYYFCVTLCLNKTFKNKSLTIPQLSIFLMNHDHTANQTTSSYMETLERVISLWYFFQHFSSSASY